MLHQAIDNIHRIVVPNVIKGETISESQVEHHSRATGEVVMTPAIDLNTLIWPRSEPGPAFQTPISDIVDFLVEVGKALDFDKNVHLQEAAARNVHFNTLDRKSTRLNSSH